MDSPVTSEGRPRWVGLIAAVCAIMWLLAEWLQRPAAHAGLSFIVLALLFVPVSRRIRPWIAVLGSVGSAVIFAACLVALLSGLHGPPALWAMCGAMACLAVVVPIVFAATFPSDDPEDDH